MRRLWSGKRSFCGSRVLGSILGMCLLLLPLTGCTNNNNPVASVLKLTPLDLSIPTDALKSPVVKQLPDNTVLRVRVTLKLDSNTMRQMQGQQVQPGQPSHLEGVAKKLGIDDGTYQKFKDFFKLDGISLRLSKLRTQLAINARTGLIAKVLKTKFVVHRYQGHTFYAPDAKNPPMVPAFLFDHIAAITGLDNYSSQPIHASTFTPEQVALAQRTHADCSPDQQTLLPKDIAHAYGFDQLWQNGFHGENMSINLVEIDGSYKSDVQNYLDCIQFKGKINPVDVDGHPTDALGESTLDIQMVAGLARSATINVYQTNASDNSTNDIWVNVNDELQRILDDNFQHANAGGTVSISLGISEGEMSQQDMHAIDQSIQQLTQIEHMAVFVASGDCGAFTSQHYGNLSVSFPASDPWAVSVGGSILQIDAGQNRAQEVAWSDDSNRRSCKNSWGTGGGLSQIFSEPSWQNQPGIKNQSSNGRRQIPDVSAVAYGLAVYYQGQWGAVGGTSAAAPIWAAGLALVHQGLLSHHKAFSATPDVFYKVAQNNNRSYYDVTQGNNLYYQATNGWDYTTGLGTPNLSTFYATLLQS
ncbi:S53 family peptidase [Dictyobacter arantiisoli]|uniref:Pseudomonapepsin n=1 Tax=Dictyobacter arantiisoli TaxID=2014874 RepID=A0A5A5TCW6_9CHLR|nr:S53 family peptidase [Dictyobacter arantiisoli]GCF09187.1 pseudomonapepsin [Dictyobacter arantiisoli]